MSCLLLTHSLPGRPDRGFLLELHVLPPCCRSKTKDLPRFAPSRRGLGLLLSKIQLCYNSKHGQAIQSRATDGVKSVFQSPSRSSVCIPLWFAGKRHSKCVKRPGYWAVSDT